jgi:hypothetical protein
VFNTLSDPATITTDLSGLPLKVIIELGAPLVLGLAEAGPLATTSGAFRSLLRRADQW